MAAPHMAAPRLAPQAPHPAPQRFARPSGGPSRSAAIRHAPTARAPEPAARARPQFGQNGRNLAQPKPRDNLARQPGGGGPSPRIGRNATPPNAPAQKQAGRAFQRAGGNRALAAHVLRNPSFADQSTAPDPSARALSRSKFQGRFFDRGWGQRYAYPAVIGWVGPLYWPYAYDDFVDYTFYPYAYDAFWPYAYEDLYDGMFGAYAQGYGGTYAAVGRGAASGGSRSVSTDLCSGQTAGLTDWPIERIAQTIEPNDAQRAALDELKTATAKALDVLKASCPSELPSTPTGRIEAMRQRLAAMLEAVRILLPAMEKLYQSLDDEQRARFNALNPDEGQQQSSRELSQVCGERAAGIAQLPLERIERTVRPDQGQRSALRELQDATSQAIDLLKSDCPTYRPLTPVVRLQAMEQRLDAMLRATQMVEPALEKFYSSLSDEQKERFNRLAPARG
jgi:ABC-type transporter MlaC component